MPLKRVVSCRSCSRGEGELGGESPARASRGGERVPFAGAAGPGSVRPPLLGPFCLLRRMIMGEDFFSASCHVCSLK